MISGNKTNILQVITGLGKGGAERVVLDLCKNINKSKYNVYVLSFGNRDALLPLFKDANIDVTFIYLNRFVELAGFVKSFKNILKSKNISIIHAHLFHSLLFSIVLNCISFFRYKIVFTSHSNLGSKFRELILCLLKNFRSVDIIFSLSQKRYFDKSNSVVIQNGIDAKSYDLDALKNNLFTFITIGRLEHVKNHLKFLDILKSVESEKKFEVWIVGEGYLKSQIEQKVKDLELENRIKMLGFRTDIKELCCKSHCFILPSIWEGLPIALIEAGASGLPVISTPVGSIPDLINDETGYLSPIESFGSVMSYVLSNYDDAKKKGAALKQHIQAEYDVKSMVRKHEDLYSQVMST